jgi:rSAM/selenodomain-associated transferase 1
MKRPGIAIFARAPVPGEAKTRLIPELGAERAAEIAAQLVRLTVELVTEFWPGEVYLYGAPDAEHPLFRKLANELHVHLRPQHAGDLGARMALALDELIGVHEAGAIIGCDVPHCPWHVIEQAYELLAKGRNVIGPAEDGGYYFIGLQAATPGMFSELSWGAPTVLEQTLARAGDAGIELEQLPRLRDVDTYADLVAVARELPALAALVPAVVEMPQCGTRPPM